MSDGQRALSQVFEAHGITAEDIKMLNALIDDDPHPSMLSLYTSTRAKWIKLGVIAGTGALTLNRDDASGAVSLVDQPDGKLTLKK